MSFNPQLTSTLQKNITRKDKKWINWQEFYLKNLFDEKLNQFMVGGVGNVNRVEVIVGTGGSVEDTGRVGNGIKSGFIEISVVVDVVCDIIGGVGIVDVDSDVVEVDSGVVEVDSGVVDVDRNVDVVVDDWVVTGVVIGVVIVIIGGVGLVDDLTHSEFLVLMHADILSIKIQPLGQCNNSKIPLWHL